MSHKHIHAKTNEVVNGLLSYRYVCAKLWGSIEPVSKNKQADVTFMRHAFDMDTLNVDEEDCITGIGFYHGDPEVFIITPEGVCLQDSRLHVFDNPDTGDNVWAQMNNINDFNEIQRDDLTCITHVYEPKSGYFIGTTFLAASFKR